MNDASSSLNTSSGFAKIRQDMNHVIDNNDMLDYTDILSDLTGTFKKGITKSLFWRKRQLLNLHNGFIKNHEMITEAICADLGGSKFRGLVENTTAGAIKDCLDNVEYWSQPEKVKHNAFLGKSLVRKEPKGVVLLIAPWNYPINLVFKPLAAIIAAGNWFVLLIVIRRRRIHPPPPPLALALAPSRFTDSRRRVPPPQPLALAPSRTSRVSSMHVRTRAAHSSSSSTISRRTTTYPHSCVIKPSEMAPRSARVIEFLVKTYLDPACFRVVQGAVPETTALLKLRWDHIIYTGNGAVAKIVMNAAAKHLIPVTLELGGKSPVIIDETAKLSLAVRRLAFGKWLNVGQTCVSPDYVLVHRSRKDEFLRELTKVVRNMYGKDPRKSKDYGRIIHTRHAERIESLLNDTTGDIIVGADAGKTDAAEKYVPPTIVVDPPASDRLLRDEIFGPVLPVCSFDTIDEAVDRIAAICDHPLALYIFSENEANVERILSKTTSGGVGVNCVMEQLHDQLPFGGIGESGMGKYGGKWGFEEFSHFRAVCMKDTRFTGAGVLLPPYGPRVYDFGIKFLVTGFFTDTQRRVLKAIAATSGVAVAAFLLRKGLSRL